MGYRKEDMERLRAELATLPELDTIEVTKREAVRLLAKTIHQMQQKGYKLERIAELVSKSGVEISATTLKSYLYLAKDGSKGTRGSGGERASRRESGRKVSVASAALKAKRESVVRESEAAGSVAVTTAEGTKNQSDAERTGTPAAMTRERSVNPEKASFRPREDSDEI